jgi:diguanylate cyclase (GGDEF)-like protein/PAS domain S-box-containing protein
VTADLGLPPPLQQDDGAAGREPGSAQVTDELLRSAFDHAPTGMAVVTPTGVLTACNRALARLLGRPAAELVGGTLFAVTHPDELERARASCSGLSTQEEPVLRHESRFLRPDGAVVEVVVTTSRVSDATGSPTHLVMHIEDIGERKALEAEIVHRALHDPLTGLPNRALLHDRIAHALARTHRFPSPACVFLLDLDGFKQVNDRHGHAAGDELLQQFAARLTRLLRPSDTAARLGGDEFVVLCEDTGPDRAAAITDRLRNAAAWPFDLGGHRVSVSASIGSSTSDPAGGPDLDPAELLRRADAQMYLDKRRPRRTRR